MKTKIFIALFLGMIFSFMATACEEENVDSTENLKHGRIVGYIKCTNTETEKTIFGTCVITSSADSLLFFNMPASVHNIDTTNINYGVYDFWGDSVGFEFRIANETEIEEFFCPPNSHDLPEIYPLLDFSQSIFIKGGVL